MFIKFNKPRKEKIKMGKLKNILIILALLVFMPLFAFAEEYEIVLTRPFKVGDACKISALTRDNEKLTVLVGGEIKEKKDEILEVHLEAIATVLGTDEFGRVNKGHINIQNFVIDKNGETETPFPKGTSVIAFVRDKKENFLVNGQAVNDDINKAFGMVITLSTGGPNDDDIFGSKEKRRIGEKWEINKKNAVADLKESYFNVDNINGVVTLDKIVNEDGIDCLQLSTKIQAKNFELGDEFPPDVSVETELADMQGIQKGLFPIDTNIGIIKENHEMYISTRATARSTSNSNAPEITLEANFERHLTRKYSYFSGENLLKELNATVTALYKQRKYSNAINIARRALEVSEKVFGLNHPEVAKSLNNLAFLFYKKGKYSDAELLYKRSLSIMEKTLVEYHPSFITLLENMVKCYKKSGNVSEAYKLEERINASRLKIQ